MREGFSFTTYKDAAAFLADMHQALTPAAVVAVDLETTGVLPGKRVRWMGKMRGAFIVCISVTVSTTEGTWTGVLIEPDADALNSVGELARGHVTVGHICDFDDLWIRAAGAEVAFTDDTGFMARVWGGASSAGLKSLVSQQYGDDYGIAVDLASLQDQLRRDAEAVWEYAALDTYYTARLYRDFFHLLAPGEMAVYQGVLRPMIPLLARLNASPAMPLDREAGEAAQQRYAEQVEAARAAFTAEVGEHPEDAWSLDHPAEIADALDTIGVELTVKTKSGYSTATDALRPLAGHPAVDAVLAWREALTPLRQLGSLLRHEGDRIPARYQMRTVTGRLNCEKENLQGLSKATKAAVGTRPGFKLVELDYSQMELRVAAAVSGDAEMMAAYQRGEDLHRVTAGRMLGVAPAAVSDAQRQTAKAVNFGLIYGQGWRGLQAYAAGTYGVELSDTEAQAWRRTFFESYPALRRWHAAVGEALDAHREGDTTWLAMPLGHTMRWREGSADQKKRVLTWASIERKAVNAVIQSTAAFLLFRALIETETLIEDDYEGVRLVGTVHDSALYEVPDEDVAAFIEDARAIFQDDALLLEPLGTGPLGVPLVADVSVGRCWAAMKELT